MGIFQSVAVSAHFQNSKRDSWLLYIGKHLPEEGFVLFPSVSQPHLRNQVTEWKRRRQRVSRSNKLDLDLLKYYLKRCVVTHEMVSEFHHQPAVLSGIVSNVNAQQRRAPNVKPEPARMKVLI
jgi:hypothetical protein